MQYIAVVVTLIVSALVAYKRMTSRTWDVRNPQHALLLSIAVYWAPAFLVSAWLIHKLASVMGLSVLTQQIAIFVIGSVLVELTLRKEFTALKRKRA
jgi:hypothetical protein